MEDAIVRAQHYGDQAAKLLAMADNEPNQRIREELKGLADQYAKLVAELMLRGPPKLS